jgi:hypothetical protein
MTDIWRSFVAQRIAWENDWRIMFHSSTVYQERNEHDLMRDFEDEISGYLYNNRIKETLGGLRLKKGKEYLGENLVTCYSAIVDLGLIGGEEINLLAAWNQDMQAIS